MIIGITGTLAAGKGTIVDFLKKRGFKHYSVRRFLMEEIRKREMLMNRDSMVIVANDLRAKFGSNYIVEQLYEEAKRNGGDSVIESLRATGEIRSLKNKEEFYLLAIDANQDIRYSRAIKRATETDSVNIETFKQNEKREMQNKNPTKQNISRCMEMADFTLKNNGSLEKLYIQIELILKKIEKKYQPTVNGKYLARADHISWDEYFMGVALLSAQRSKDPSTQVGACIVDEYKRIVGTGYNGATRGFDDKEFPWKREGNFLDTKYAFVCHAELNAILNSTKESLKECVLYVALFPCNECAKAIIQSRIKKVIYMSDKYKNTDSHIASKKMLEMAGVELVKFESNIDAIKLNFDKARW